MLIGMGYVGLSTAACSVSRGIRVVGVDIDGSRISSLSRLAQSRTRLKVLSVLERKSGGKVGKDFGLVTNPEFLRKGKAL